MYSWYCFILNFVRVHKDDKEDMEMAFKEVAIESLEFNPFTKISKEWMLVTAGDEKKSNTMTASWGGVGIMWGKNIATAYIRPQRYTKKFMDETGMYTLSFLSEDTQAIVAEYAEDCKIDMKSAKMLRASADSEGNIDRNTVHAILYGEDTEPKVKPKSVKISHDIYTKYFSNGEKPKEITETIEKALELYFKNMEDE
jgi:hypothetical protein